MQNKLTNTFVYPYRKTVLLDNEFVEIATTSYSDGFLMDYHNHPYTQISYVLRGSNYETTETVAHLARAGEVIIKPKELIHKNIFSDNCTTITVNLRKENFTHIFQDHLLKERSSFIGEGGYQLIKSLITCQNEKQYYSCLNKALISISKAEKQKSPSAPFWLLDLKNLLDVTFQDSIKAEQIGRIFNKHPVYIARTFKKYFGLNIKSYLKILRTNAAMSSIIYKEDVLAGVAIKNGFSDQSHLNRAFKDTTGLTPFEFKNFVA